MTEALDAADLAYNEGVALYGLGRKAEALARFEAALALSPAHLPALANRARTLEQLGRWQDAVDAADAGLRLVSHPALLHPKADALMALERFAEAADAYALMLQAAPGHVGALNNLGVALAFGGDLEGAAAVLVTLVRTVGDADAHYSLGNVLRDLGRYDEALASYDRAIAAGDPVGAVISRAQLLLLQGDFEAGWPGYEARWRFEQAGQGAPLDPALHAVASHLQGKRLLLEAEQGFGDTLQMLRYAPLAAAAGAEVLLRVQAPLVALARTVPGAAEVLSMDDPRPHADILCPMMSLPLLFGTTMETIPANVPYLSVAPEARAVWAGRLPGGGKPKVGLAWSGNPAHNNDRNRSVPLALLAPLLALDCQFVSLLKDVRPQDAAALAGTANLLDAGPLIGDFADAAALVQTLDLVITVDTAAAHLAGALGKPVWLMLPFAPDFRWLLGRDDSPWYPTMRIFRQPRPGDWEAVARVVAEALGPWAKASE